MSSLPKQFNDLDTLTAIKAASTNASSSDGEYSWLELKSVGKFDKQAKERIAKEVCAFSNTYGGVLVLQGIPDIDAPLDTSVIALFDALESFLADCLEPPLSGIDAKVVEDRIVIGVPESATKPHRTISGKKGSQYYYRNVTSAVPMPEVMVRSLYTSQAVLSVQHWATFNDQELRIGIQNKSQVVGTKPRIEFSMLYKPKSPSPRSAKPTFLAAHDFEPRTAFTELMRYLPGDGFKFELGNTTKVFRDEILYPYSTLLATNGMPPPPFSAEACVLLQTNAFFAEAPPTTRFHLIGTGEPPTSDEKAGLGQMVEKFIKFFKG